MDPSPKILRAQDMLGSYRIDKVIGYGGMAVVYRAKQVSLDRWVALKVLDAQGGGDAGFRERFQREGKHVAALRHPSIVTVYDQGEADGRLFIAMELIAGNLATRLRNPGLSAQATLDILTPIADALDAAHRAGLIHRDVKPQNILLDDRDHPYLADFGIAKAAGAPGVTSPGGFVGSIDYAAPEQFRGAPGPACDVYALSAVLYECLTAEVPFPRDREVASMWAHLEEPPPSIRTRDPQAPEALDLVIARGLAKDTAQRPGSAGELMAEARAAVSGIDPSLLQRAPAFPGRPGEPAAGDIVPRGAQTGGGPPAGDAAPAEVATAGENVPAGERPVDAAPGDLPATRDGDLPRVVVLPADAPAADDLGAPGEASSATMADPLGREMAVAGEPPAGRRRLPELLQAPATQRGGALAVLAVLAVLLPAGALALRQSPEREVSRTARGGVLSLTYTSGWRTTAAAPSSGLDRAVALRSTRVPSMRVRAGTVQAPAPVPGGLPRLLARDTAMSGSSYVRLGDLQARRYDLTADQVQQRLRVYVISSERVDGAIVCTMASDEASDGLAACDGLAASVRLQGARAIAPAADPVLAAALVRLTTGLRAATGVAEPGLASRSRARRAAAATRLAVAHRKAVVELADIRTRARDEPAITRLGRRLGELATAYEELARRGSRQRYDRARSRQRFAQIRTRRALDQLASIGYPHVR